MTTFHPKAFVRLLRRQLSGVTMLSFYSYCSSSLYCLFIFCCTCLRQHKPRQGTYCTTRCSLSPLCMPWTSSSISISIHFLSLFPFHFLISTGAPPTDLYHFQIPTFLWLFNGFSISSLPLLFPSLFQFLDLS